MSKQYHDIELTKSIILKIKELRNTHNVTQEIFYIDTGIHIARIEQGKINITVSTLSKICDYFNITLKDFFGSINK